MGEDDPFRLYIICLSFYMMQKKEYDFLPIVKCKVSNMSLYVDDRISVRSLKVTK